MNTVHKIKTFPACKFNHVGSPTDFRQWLPIESAKHLCLRVIWRWLISLAVPALAGMCIGRMSCGPDPQQTPWLCPASGLGQDRCDHEFSHTVHAQSQQEVHCAVWESAAGLTGGCSRWASLLLHGQKPSFMLSLTHMLKLWWFGVVLYQPWLEGDFHNFSNEPPQSFNNAAIYRLSLCWINCRSCTKAHSVSAMKLQRNIRADWNHSVWLHIIKYNLCFAWLDSLLNWKVNGILTHL